MGIKMKKKIGVLDCKWQKIIAIGVFVRAGRGVGRTDSNLRVVRLGVRPSPPAVFSVGGWDGNRDSIPFLSKAEMRVFLWMPNLPWGHAAPPLTLFSVRALAHGVGHAHLSRQTLVSLALWVYEFALCSKAFYLILRSNKGGATKEPASPTFCPNALRASCVALSNTGD